MAPEQPGVLMDSLNVISDHMGIPSPAIARALLIKPRLLDRILDRDTVPKPDNVFRLF
jgi:hypothetical protein